MICPLLKRTRMERTECDFVDLCTPKYCVWAKFHMLDPLSAKPLTPCFYCARVGEHDDQCPARIVAAQKDLFA
jgi:hypothetical protein